MKHILWFYNENHWQHPFIVIAAETLAKAGFHVTVLNTHDAPEGRVHYHTRCLFPERIKRKNTAPKKNASLTPPPAFSWRKYRAEQHNQFNKFRYFTRVIWRKTLRKAWSMPVDIVIGTRPESAFVGWILARLKRKRFVYFTFELSGNRRNKGSPILYNCDRILIKTADALITQNDARARVYKEEFGCRATPAIIHNYKPRREVMQTGALRALLGVPASQKIVLYEGNLMEGRWLEQLALAALQLPPDVLLVMLGEDRLGWADVHAETLAAPLASGRLRILPPVAHDDLLAYVADADVGVIIYDDSNRNNFFCEPGKLSDYLAAGVPMIAPAFPTLQPVIEHYGIGVCFTHGTPEAIAQSIMAVLATNRAAWQPALATARDALTWESQVSALLEAVTGKKQK